MEHNYQLEVGDVVLVTEGGWGLLPEDENKYVEVTDKDGVGYVAVKPYDKPLAYYPEGCSVGYESFGESPMILLNTKDQIKEKEVSALDKQVGGGHYKDKGIQPIQYIFANNLGFCEANIVKYASRWKEKGGIQDLEKVIHYAELLIEQARKEGYK